MHRSLLPVFAIAALPLWGLDGGNPVFINTPSPSGWKTFEIISRDDTLGPLAKEGFVWTAKHVDWDGVGAYLHDSSTLRVFVNHEEPDSTFSRIDLDVANLKTWIANGIADNTNNNQVTAPGTIVEAVSLGWTSVGSGTNPVDNPCSGNVWLADTFGPGRGFADSLYLTAEEVSVTGTFWVMDLATRTIYEAVDLGTGKWENATIIDTGRTDTVALLLSEDIGASTAGTAPIRLYVGEKNAGGNFLERNGLSGGTIYHWDPNMSTSTNGTIRNDMISDIFAGGNGTVVPGTWVLSSAGAVLISKSEDVHTNMNPLSPGYGVEAVLASQNQGIFKIDFSQLDFVTGDLGTNRDSDIMVLFEAGTEDFTTGFYGMDNLVWAGDGMIYVNEDDGEGDIWRVDPASLEASYAMNDFTPTKAQVFYLLDADFVQESSGIFEISSLLDYPPGTVFFTTGQSNSGTNQLALMVAPTHSLNFASGTGGTISGVASQILIPGNDGTPVTAVPAPGYGFIAWSDGVLTPSRTNLNVTADVSATARFAPNDYLTWASTYPSLSEVDSFTDADPDLDGVTNFVEYASNLNPTTNDTGILTAGTGTAGLPLVEIRDTGASERLVVEYLRRIDSSNLTYTPQFGSDLMPTSWGPGGTETVTPIDSTFERVLIEDSMDLTLPLMRFGRVQISATPTP